MNKNWLNIVAAILVVIAGTTVTSAVAVALGITFPNLATAVVFVMLNMFYGIAIYKTAM